MTKKQQLETATIVVSISGLTVAAKITLEIKIQILSVSPSLWANEL